MLNEDSLQNNTETNAINTSSEKTNIINSEDANRNGDIDTKKRKRIYIKKAHNLPHPNIRFEQQLKMLKAYVIATNKGAKGIKYSDLKGIIDFSLGYVSATNKFLEETGLLEKRHGLGMYAPTKETIEFQNYLDWDNESKAKEILKNVINKSWFWESAKQLLSMNNGKASEEDIIRKMGLDSQADAYRHNLCFRSVLEYLKYTELIVENEDDFFIMTSPDNEKALKNSDTQEIDQTNATIKKKEQIQISPEISDTSLDMANAIEIKFSGTYLKIVPTKENIEKIKKLLEAIKPK